MDKTFYLSAGLGDCIYSLPTVREMGGGTFIYGGSYKGYEAIKPLLEEQFCITKCVHSSQVSLPQGFINLDWFRNSPDFGKRHFVQLFREQFNLPPYDFIKNSGWLEDIRTVKASFYPYAIVNVTPRYRDKVFKRLGGWDREIKKLYKMGVDKMFFMGFIEDYEELKSYTNSPIDYFPTNNLLEAAQMIKGAKYFSGNQSVLLAIREGLGLPYRLEWSPNHTDTCQFNDNETIINRRTRKIHFAITSAKRLMNKEL